MEVMKLVKLTMCMVVMALCVSGIVYCVRGMKDIPEAPDPMQEFNSRMEQNYTAYLDGEEVDPVNLDVTKYSVTYNDEAKAIYLTKEGKSNISGIFLLFPIVVFLILFVPSRSR